MSSALAGKAVVITGAGSGLGAAYARHAAALGAAVLVNDLNEDLASQTASAIRAAGGRAEAFAADVAQWDHAEHLIEACLGAFGAFTGYVCNAGILRPALLENVTEADIRLMYEVNVLGTAAGVQAAARHLREIGQGGSIVTVASGSQAGDLALGGYGATKGAVASLSYAWAQELRRDGIRLNAISPLAETAMAQANAGFMALQQQDREVRYGVLPPPEVSAPLVSYLLSDASEAISGQVIRLAGRELSYLTHPQIAAPVLTDDWDFAKILDAFSTSLAQRQHSLGLTRAGPQPAEKAG